MCRSLSASGALLVLVSSVGVAQARGGNAAPVIPMREVTDGVVRLTHRADAFVRAPRWSLASEPLFTAGGADSPDYDLTNAREVELLSDGRMVTLARIGNRLLVFGPNGRGERSLGRQGNGPGEIMAPTGMSRTAGDTIVIPDGANNRINWIVPTKGFVAEKPMPNVGNSYFGIGRPVGVLRGGTLVFSTAGLVQNAKPDSVTRPPASVVVYDPRTESATVVATVPDLEIMQIPTRYRGRASTVSMPLRFTRFAEAVAWDTVIATGSGDGYRIDLRDATGRIRSSLHIPVARRRVTAAMRDSAIAQSLRRFDGPQEERMVDPAESRRIERAAPVADSLPPYGNWFVSPNRTLWAVDPIAPGETGGGATAFRQDGAIIGRLTWTRGGYPMAFGDDRVVFRDADSDGVVSLSVHRIRR